MVFGSLNMSSFEKNEARNAYLTLIFLSICHTFRTFILNLAMSFFYWGMYMYDVGSRMKQLNIDLSPPTNCVMSYLYRPCGACVMYWPCDPAWSIHHTNNLDPHDLWPWALWPLTLTHVTLDGISWLKLKWLSVNIIIYVITCFCNQKEWLQSRSFGKPRSRSLWRSQSRSRSQALKNLGSRSLTPKKPASWSRRRLRPMSVIHISFFR